MFLYNQLIETGSGAGKLLTIVSKKTYNGLHFSIQIAEKISTSVD
jgi:hypothetical protein